MVTPYHVPVMAEPVVALMAEAPAGPIVDGTLGGGGHAEALLTAQPERPIIGVDQDPEALSEAAERFGASGAVRFVRGNFRDLGAILAEALGPGEKVSGILLDLGVSSWQLDAPHRGFAIKHPDAPLDMRMDPTDASTPTAVGLIREHSTAELATILGRYGEVRGARRVAARLKEAVDADRLVTSGDLAREVEAVQKNTASRGGRRVHPATQVFQALRIAVNDELGALDAILDAAPDLLVDGGRLAIISYHSLEDRRVKQAFRLGEQGPPRPSRLPPPTSWRATWTVLTRRAIKATDAEISGNARARSARLRAAARAPRVGGPA